jgi:hypothetical protein
MADTKISALTAATLPLAGTESVPVVQGGATKRAPASAFGLVQRWDSATDYPSGIHPDDLDFDEVWPEGIVIVPAVAGVVHQVVRATAYIPADAAATSGDLVGEPISVQYTSASTLPNANGAGCQLTSGYLDDRGALVVRPGESRAFDEDNGNPALIPRIVGSQLAVMPGNLWFPRAVDAADITIDTAGAGVPDIWSAQFTFTGTDGRESYFNAEGTASAGAITAVTPANDRGVWPDHVNEEFTDGAGWGAVLIPTEVQPLGTPPNFGTAGLRVVVDYVSHEVA